MNSPARLRWLRVLVFSLSIFGGLGVAPFAEAGLSATPATITFRKIFKSSYPEFVEIKVSDSGSGTCEHPPAQRGIQSPDDAD